MDLSGDGLLWYGRPQLFFKCTVAPTGHLHHKGRHMELALSYFSTFDPAETMKRRRSEREEPAGVEDESGDE